VEEALAEGEEGGMVAAFIAAAAGALASARAPCILGTWHTISLHTKLTYYGWL
jgi:hypothetical protein